MRRSEIMLRLARIFPQPVRVVLNLSRKHYIPSRLLQHWLSQVLAKELAIPLYEDHWARTVMYQECFTLLRDLEPSKLDVLQISPRNADVFVKLNFKSCRNVDFPLFDICKDCLDDQFDLIIADQVFEHLLWPYRAAKNVWKMLRPVGYFLITTPFLVRVHEHPVDCSRWTELGLRHFLAECGFPLSEIRTGSWGNLGCVKANFKRWAPQRFWCSLRNEPNFPVSVWALAKKSN